MGSYTSAWSTALPIPALMEGEGKEGYGGGEDEGTHEILELPTGLLNDAVLPAGYNAHVA